jgi:signal transduction histidine kinase
MATFWNIRLKVTSLLVAAFATLVAAQFLIHERVLMPSFAAIEQQAALTDMDRVVNAIRGEQAQLSIIAWDWGNWSKTWEFYQDRNATYLKNNLTAGQMQTLHINLLAFVDLDGNFIAAKGLAPDLSHDLDIDFARRGALTSRHPWRQALQRGSRVQGLFATDQGVMLAAASPVLDGAGLGPHRGMVLMGILLTPAEVSRIGEQAQVIVWFDDLRESVPRAANRTALPSQDQFTIIARDLKGIDGAVVGTARIAVPKKITAQGQRTARSSEIFLVLACIAALVLLAFTLQRIVLDPLSRLQRFAVAISATGNLTARTNLVRRDEIGVLALEMDRMVQNLDQAQRKLLDLSFSAGSAEMASGVLHNIGNALTPVAVAVASLQARLGAAPVGDLQLVLDELEFGAAPDRQSDLRQFLYLSSRELAATVSRSGDDVAVVARQIEQIRNILTHQSTLARTGPVIETVLLADLVTTAAEALPAQMRALLIIDVDESLRALGPVNVERILLKQVFQNLLLNAAESVRDAGHGAQVLSVSCSVQSVAEGEQLEIRFRDHGAGIPAENLARIFEKGFSTKTTHHNSGIGLHWCANTLGALGGRLLADSPGVGQGATLRVVLPLHRAHDVAATQAA